MAHTESGNRKTTATVTIDGRQVTVPVAATILDAAAELGITIPTLCWLKKISTTGACRVCVVEVEGVDRFMTACNTPVKDGIVVTTTSPKLEETRKKTLELMLVNHPLDCPVCDAAGECDLQNACYTLKVDKNSYCADPERLPIRYDWKLLESDPNRCILCEKCVKVCREIVGREAIEIVDRGERTIIDTITGQPLDCEFCGNCINACPTGTLISKPFKFRGRPWTFDVTPGICTFCSSGCQIEYHSREGRVERVTSQDDTFNRGNLCVNGRFGYAAFNSPGRLAAPLLKDVEEIQQKSSWDQALGTVAAKLRNIIAADGSAAVAGIGSQRATNEDNYLFQKFMRAAVGTNNIDSEARLGYLPAQISQYEMLGYSGGTFAMDAIENASAILVIGSDLKAESAGFAYRVIHAATRNNARLVLAHTRSTSLNKYANAFLQYRPGSEAWLAAGINKTILAEGLENRKFIDGNTTGFDALNSSLEALSFERITEVTGIAENALREAARLVSAGRLAIIYGCGIMRSPDAANAVSAVVNLALLTGSVSDQGGGIYPLDEKNNTQGMLDMGICPEYLPGYHRYDHASAKFNTAWNTSIATTPGKNLMQIVEAIEAGKIKALYVMGSDPVQYVPDRVRLVKALQKLELLVVQDIFLTETARLATAVFPAATAAEKSGSFTTVDNRVQCFTAAVSPPTGTRTDSDILTSLHALVASADICQDSPEKLHHEITELTGLYSETCDHDGCRMGRVKSRTGFIDRKAIFKPLQPLAVASSDAAHPFTLTTGPLLHHNGSFTAWSANNMLVSPEAYLEMGIADADKTGCTAGDTVKVTSAKGSVFMKVRISPSLQPGVLFAPYIARDVQINTLVQTSCVTAVSLAKA